MSARIAVIDDDATFLDFLQALLVDEGHEVLKLKDGRTAFEQLHAPRPDCIIVDIRLEHPTSGWDILAHVWGDPTLAATPAIVCSGDVTALDAHRQELERHGSVALAKPFDIDDLLSVLARLLPAPGNTI